ncbi:tRNA-dihydrouridine synthase [Candidatus Woesearchaeota archaeon]|nr:tRNA-dihydrouridine synthase [Candidatus Woesearchaeota archaeon]
MGLSKPTFLGKEVSGKFTIPSGIVTTDAKVIERIAREVPEVGVITTKSIGPVPREGNPDRIITQYAPGCFMNAVGLTNPGAEEFAEQLAGISLPDNRFLLTSIFGGNAEEFVKVAKILAPHSDGLELNLSCPHAKGYGMAIGQDPEAVRGIVSAVKNAVGIPVVAKLTPNAPDIAAIAKAAVEGGADAICAINTVGPGYYTHDGNPVLLNEQGGMSGKGILPIGLKCVKQIRDAVSVPIIGCGGASTAEHVRAYRQAGASVVGIGSGLTGMTTEDLKEYFSALAADVNMGTNDAAAMLQHADTDFQKYRLVENRQIADDMSVLVFDRKIKAEPGQFIFAWVKGCAEKPFSILDDDPLTLAVQKRGCLSETLIRLKEGAEVYFRGPYGHAVKVPAGKKPVLVAGGCGLAAVYMIARENEGAEIFIGARDKEHLFYLENARRVATVHVATEDGSEGQTGRVTDLMRQKLQLMRSKDEIVFYNCGPEPMIKAVTELENRYALSRNIYNSIDYITKCGIGLCGSCATKDGKRLCVDGPFIQEEK